MNNEIFSEKDTLKEISRKLMQHLYLDAYVIFRNGKGAEIYIPENGDCSFWFDDFVKIILKKAANKDVELVKMCLENGIPIYDIQVKK